MKIIVPMAGRGSRLRPHTLTVPKPLIPIAGKPIVQRLVEDIVSVCGDKKVDEIAFIIGDFGDHVEAQHAMGRARVHVSSCGAVVLVHAHACHAVWWCSCSSSLSLLMFPLALCSFSRKGGARCAQDEGQDPSQAARATLRKSGRPRRDCQSNAHAR